MDMAISSVNASKSMYSVSDIILKPLLIFFTCIILVSAVPPVIAKIQNMPFETITVPHGVLWPLEEPQVAAITIGNNAMVPEGYHLTIECKTPRANPKPSIVWHLGDKSIKGPQYTVKENGKLIISSLLRNRDEGVYTCIADTQNVGQDNSSSTVIVTGKFLL